MSSELTTSPFFLAAIMLGTLGVILILAGIVAVMRARPLPFAIWTLAGLVLLLMGALAAAIAIGTQGYLALTREDLAASLFVQPDGSQRFAAVVRFPDGRQARYELAGDEIYVDAHILKWKPLANILGLHTAYELDRVGGRYHAIEEERSAVRTVYSLTHDKPVDLFGLRRRYAFLSVLLDAEYGSATFIPVTGSAEFELRVSTTGLLIREAIPHPGVNVLPVKKTGWYETVVETYNSFMAPSPP
ncbi:MAG TPA: hypothetical protein VGJ57_01855 [Nitrospirales bacterium]|jgi:hypothetical protein